MNPHKGQTVLRSGQGLENAEKAVVLIHGRGATASSILQLSEALPEAAYLAPQASGRTWYPESFMELRKENQPHLDSALEKVGSVVEEVEKHLPREKIILLGFSQGACLASEFVARNPERYGGLLAFSGGLIGEEVSEFSGDMDGTPVFLGCSENDPHIPLERVNATEKVFKDLNAEVEKYIFEGSHHGIVDHEMERAAEMVSGC